MNSSADTASRVKEVDGLRLLQLNVLDPAADLSAIAALDLDGLDCNWHQAWRAGDLEFLRDNRTIRALRIASPYSMDYSPIENLESLEYLYLDPIVESIDLTRLLQLKHLTMKWTPGVRLAKVSPQLRHLSISRFKPKTRSFETLPEAPLLEHLGVGDSNVRNVAGLRRLINLRVLTLMDCRALADISELAYCHRLEEVTLYRCTKLHDFSPLAGCGNLRTIEINYSKVASIEFVGQLRKLTRLGLMFSVVLDNDLSPAMGVDWVVFADRKGYNYTRSQINPDLARGITSPEARGRPESTVEDHVEYDDEGRIRYRVRKFKDA